MAGKLAAVGRAVPALSHPRPGRSPGGRSGVTRLPETRLQLYSDI